MNNALSKPSPLQQFRARADRVLVWTLAALLFICGGIASANGTWDALVLIGVPALLVPAIIALAAPGQFVARLGTGTALMVFSALMIHQTEGMIEAHFGVFGLLAFTLLYADWRVVLSAACVIAIHHITFFLLRSTQFGVWAFPESYSFNYMLMHLSYVLFETIILMYMAVMLEAMLLRLHLAIGKDR